MVGFLEMSVSSKNKNKNHNHDSLRPKNKFQEEMDRCDQLKWARQSEFHYCKCTAADDTTYQRSDVTQMEKNGKMKKIKPNPSNQNKWGGRKNKPKSQNHNFQIMLLQSVHCSLTNCKSHPHFYRKA